MKKTALICAIFLVFTLLPRVAIAGSDITVSVTDVARDIVTVSGSAPVDAIALVTILNPGKSLADIKNSSDAVQYMGVAYSSGGKFVCPVYMNTGEEPNKKEGAFTVLVSIGGELVYSSDNFVFYSNSTKQGYLNDLKSGTKEQLLTESNGVSKIEKIFETYSLANHELYVGVTGEELAETVVAQSERVLLQEPTDIDAFLVKVLVLNAFANGNDTLKLNDGGLKYTEIWALENEEVSVFYTDSFTNDLSNDGKTAVVNAVLSADYKDANFEKPLEYFKEAVLYNIVMNNNVMGSGRIGEYILEKYTNEYKNLGFDVSALSKIKSEEKRLEIYDDLLASGASDIKDLKNKFNELVKNTGNDKDNESGSLPSTKVPSSGGGGGGGGGAKPTATPVPTPAPTQTPHEDPTPEDTAYPFADMGSAAWAEDAVKYLYEKGIVNGRDEKTFAPGETVTRAELVKMIVEALSVADAAEDKTFSDVADTDWFAPYVKKAAAAGIVNGDGDSFKPNGAVTREDATVIIYRALGLEAVGVADFTDAADISDYAKDAISAMSAGGYINGMGDGTFAPKNTLTRAQAAQLIYNALVKGDAVA